MLASVALIASGGDRYLQSAGGLSQALEQRLAARLPQPEQKTSLQPIAAPQPSSAMPSLAGGSAWINSPALTPERLKGKGFLDPGVYQLSAYPALRARLGEQIPRGRPCGYWRSYPGISLGAFVAPAAPGGEGLADNLPGGGG